MGLELLRQLVLLGERDDMVNTLEFPQCISLEGEFESSGRRACVCARIGPLAEGSFVKMVETIGYDLSAWCHVAT